MPFYLKNEETEEEYKKMMDHFRSTSSYSFPASTQFSVSDIFNAKKGMMFAILIARTESNQKVVLRGFSGQAFAHHRIPGYVPPCYSEKAWQEINALYDPMIKELDQMVEEGDKEAEKERKRLSQEASGKIRDIHLFHDADGKTFTLEEIEEKMPTGSGDCAGTKVINYAMKKGYRISGFTEFYLGKDTNERKNGQFYPPCRQRCEKIISRMLKLDFIYLDEEIAVINKPSGLLSVPGKGDDKKDCVSERFKQILSDPIDNPFVHRLDMDTSGIIVLARTKQAQRTLAMAFEKRSVKKEYEALLVGRVEEDEGIIDLPMRLDVERRPYQIVDMDNGKSAVTAFKKLGYTTVDGTLCSRMRFFPHTGRTHQIRVHAAYGLGHPIYSDRLYGNQIEGRRLMLHASRLEINHPTTGEKMIFNCPAPF